MSDHTRNCLPHNAQHSPSNQLFVLNIKQYCLSLVQYYCCLLHAGWRNWTGWSGFGRTTFLSTKIRLCARLEIVLKRYMKLHHVIKYVHCTVFKSTSPQANIRKEHHLAVLTVSCTWLHYCVMSTHLYVYMHIYVLEKWLSRSVFACTINSCAKQWHLSTASTCSSSQSNRYRNIGQISDEYAITKSQVLCARNNSYLARPL